MIELFWYIGPVGMLREIMNYGGRKNENYE